MSLVTATRQTDGVTIVSLQGKLCLGEDTRNIRDLVKDLVDGGQKSLVFDMAKLDYIDSAGIGALIGCFSSARSGGGNLKLLQVGKRVRDALTITKLLPVFEVFEDEAQAVSSFAGAAEA